MYDGLSSHNLSDSRDQRGLRVLEEFLVQKKTTEGLRGGGRIEKDKTEEEGIPESYLQSFFRLYFPRVT